MTGAIWGTAIALVFAVSIAMVPAYAGSPMKVTDASVSDDTITITTAGTAGAATPDEEDKIFAYVAVTDAGIVAVTSHFGVDDDDTTGDLEWHSHIVTLDENGCVVTIDPTGVASLSGNTVTVTGTGATSVETSFGVMLKISDDGICVHKAF